MDLEGGGREQRIFFTQNYLQQLQLQLIVVQDSQNFLLYLCLLLLDKNNSCKRDYFKIKLSIIIILVIVVVSAVVRHWIYMTIQLNYDTMKSVLCNLKCFKILACQDHDCNNRVFEVCKYFMQTRKARCVNEQSF